MKQPTYWLGVYQTDSKPQCLARVGSPA